MFTGRMKVNEVEKKVNAMKWRRRWCKIGKNDWGQFKGKGWGVFWVVRGEIKEGKLKLEKKKS